MVASLLGNLTLTRGDYSISGLTKSVKSIPPRHSLTVCLAEHKEPTFPILGTPKSIGRIPLSVVPHDPVPFQCETPLVQLTRPTLPGAYCTRIVQQPMLLLLLS